MQKTKKGNKIKSVLPAPIGYKFNKFSKFNTIIGVLTIQKIFLLSLYKTIKPIKTISIIRGRTPKSFKFLKNIRLLNKSFTKLSELTANSHQFRNFYLKFIICRVEKRNCN